MNHYDSWGKGYDPWAPPSAFGKFGLKQVLVCFGVAMLVAALLAAFLFFIIFLYAA